MSGVDPHDDTAPSPTAAGSRRLGLVNKLLPEIGAWPDGVVPIGAKRMPV